MLRLEMHVVMRSILVRETCYKFNDETGAPQTHI